ncbi:hypothetical protein ElyMa_003679600 [Elysia marginata]|uniref:Uncharacterized protein n=1 Tax=Elysia marginata TaxID=1093978 RepID=A0AAV4EZB6_9GAST|nr:hypothetical protein ElyMa_003679600 [Elysia marginata]
MGRVILVTIACILVCCNGLELTLKRGGNQTVGRTRKPCGILSCTEDVSISISSTPDEDQDASNVVLNRITSMSVFQRRASTTRGNNKGTRQVRIASVTSTSPHQGRVANGRKVDGVLEPGRAEVTIELAKQGDCEAEFTCQVRGVDTRGREVVSSVRLAQQRDQDRNQVYDGSLAQPTSLQLLAAIQQLVTQAVAGLENRMADRVKTLESNVGDRMKTINDKIVELQSGLITGRDEFMNTMNERMMEFQKDIASRSDAFKHHLDNKLDLFENRVEDKIDNNNNLNKLIQLDVKVSKQLEQFRLEANADIRESLEDLTQKSDEAQRKALRNFTESVEKTLGKTSEMLTSVKSQFDDFMNYDQVKLLTIKNDTEAIHDLLTSGQLSTHCLQNDTDDSDVKSEVSSIK